MFYVYPGNLSKLKNFGNFALKNLGIYQMPSDRVEG